MSRAAARAAGMDRQTLHDWVARFNAESIAGLHDQPRTDRSVRMDEGKQAALRAMILRGPDPERDGVSARRIVDLCRLAEQHLGVRHRPSGMLRLVRSVDLSWQKTRRRHPQASEAAQEQIRNGVLL